MPARDTLRQLAPDLLNFGGDVAANILNRRTTGRAANALRGSLDSQGNLITGATDAATRGENEALRRQEELYRQTRADYSPYAEGGAEGVSALRNLVRENPTFDVSRVTEDPGYKFGLDEGLKATQRILSSRGTLNSGQSKAFIRYANDYATTKVGEARNAFNQDQQNRLNRINALTGVGEYGTSGQAGAAADFGNQIGRNATARTALTLGQADALANLEGQRGEVNFGQEVAGGNANQSLLRSALPIGLDLAAKALGIGAPAAAAAATAAGTTAAGTVAPAAAAQTAASGSLGGTLAGLATNPITIGIAGALAAGAIWLKSQLHRTADKVVKLENKFHEQSLKPFTAEWDRLARSGQLTAEQGNAAILQYAQNYQDYIDQLQQWAGSDKKKQAVARQSANNLWNTTVAAQIQRMNADVNALGSRAL